MLLPDAVRGFTGGGLIADSAAIIAKAGPRLGILLTPRGRGEHGGLVAKPDHREAASVFDPNCSQVLGVRGRPLLPCAC